MINIIVTPLLLKCMQRVFVMVSAIVLSLSFSNYSNLVEAESSTEDCWVIVKENYEWIHDDEQIVASHSSNRTLLMIRNVDWRRNGSNYRFVASLFYLIQ